MGPAIEEVEISPVVLMPAKSEVMPLIDAAVNGGADIATLERLFEMQKDWEAREAKKAFTRAMSAFQSEIPVIVKKGLASFEYKNGGGRMEYTFAKLEDITESIKSFLVQNLLTYRWESDTEQGVIKITCIVSHADGHCEKTSSISTPDTSGSKNGIQAMASATTYLKRYTLINAMGITVSDDDDDGHSAQSGSENIAEDVPEFITSDQIDRLKRMMVNANVSEGSFCHAAGIGTVESLTAARYQMGVDLLQKRIDKLKGVAA